MFKPKTGQDMVLVRLGFIGYLLARSCQNYNFVIGLSH